MKTVTVKKNDAGQRIDRFMSKLFTSMPQSLIYKSLRKDCVKVNGKHVKEGHRMLDVCKYHIPLLTESVRGYIGYVNKRGIITNDVIWQNKVF